jgi:23S rRNA pseudoU1915 N3-methylase RlmH
MFAVETIIEDSLYAIKYEGNERNEFSRLFEEWSDIEYLESFFEEHKSDLQRDFYNFISIEDAIEQTIEEADELEQNLIDIAENGKTNGSEKLQNLFHPLNDKDAQKYPIPDYQKSKAYGSCHKSWLRIYAIRIEPNVFIVTGGAIKITETMNEREHLQLELEKLSKSKNFLIDESIIDNDGIVDFLEL